MASRSAGVGGLVYDDLRLFPDDHLRRELIGGAVLTSPLLPGLSLDVDALLDASRAGH